MDTPAFIARIAAHNGGVVSRRQLVREGVDVAEIERLRSRRVITPVRRGWYATPDARPIVLAAVKCGAAITCVSALEYYPGVWIPPRRSQTHLRWPRHLKHQRTHRQCRAFRSLATPTSAVDPLPVAVLCAAQCLADEEIVAVLDSLLRPPNLWTVQDVRALFDGAPKRIVRLLGLLDPASGSGTESIVRYRLHCLGITVRTQVPLPWGIVDLLLGDKFVVECDSEGYHGGAQRRADLRRDRIAVRGDYRVMRIDYEDVIANWEEIRDDILDIVRTDRHLGKTREIRTETGTEAGSGFDAA
ncbi:MULTISPECIES: type IV toxin-antitoxin system AbiEi family antitoxin domain-containing protein [Tsukamurella]|uniref:DUF559 domain-containing protein n=2 Tax=Tsukamurella TaxID=2060 RepID=A0A5C5S4I2_9ACTN|nr:MULTISPECIES: type IV toxin-antitoxin system AbiEi family antitoxin domain-containing protein [Tsukamurella]NMD55092.1 DUF559 domain-containing protein [Tsukamurella columbiensis]TWS30119.1 DUF559 domain-containing protein [Tsukamurella conjunctivitidis]